MIKIRPVFATIMIVSMLLSFSASSGSVAFQELTLQQTQQKLLNKEISIRQLVDYYRLRILNYDKKPDGLNSVAFLHPDIDQHINAVQAKIDNKGKLGTLFGSFVLIKDNIAVKGLPNTAGSWLMRDHVARQNAFVIKKLMEQDAIILGKTNLSEWANFRSEQSSSGWSSLYGQTRNPYHKHYSPCGSSSGSGVAVAADMALFAVGTETDGSITCPAAVNGIVGIKPTLGLVSRRGIIPISHSQDTAGPMARTVEDAVHLLDAMLGKDDDDSASLTPIDVKSALVIGELAGARAGVIRNAMGYHEPMDRLFNEQLEILKQAGVNIVDVRIETLDKLGDDEYLVLLAEFRHDLNQYLKETSAPLHSLKHAIALNEKHKAIAMPFFSQNIFEKSLAAPALTAKDYIAARKNNVNNAGKMGIDKVMKAHKLNFLIAPTTSPAWKINHQDGDEYLGSVSSAPAIAGYPHVTVPMGQVSGLPVGMSFIAGHLEDATVIQAAYEYEQRSRARIAPILK